MNRFAVVLLLLATPLGAFAEQVSSVETLKQDIIQMRSFLHADQKNAAWDKAESDASLTNDLLPSLPGAKPALTVMQQRLLDRCEMAKTAAQKRRCDAMKCRLLGECRGR
jgi:hypothetical protein